MQQVKLADWNEQNSCTNIEGFTHQVVEMSELQTDFDFAGPSDPMFDLKF